MRKVPIVDTTGIKALKEFKFKCDQKGIMFLLSGIQEKIREKFKNTSIETTIGKDHIFPDIDAALLYAKQKKANYSGVLTNSAIDRE
jgi:SulP family sulfate permease